ncbi:MAG TPA: TlpA disulfide reductase family protein, partial [Armatimonadota bacterium]|nr:TlpA disulfide reductase family protein [Armatimonadota bacterium]
PGPTGAKLEQTYTCDVTPGDAPASVKRVEEWVINPPPAANVAHRITEVTRFEPVAAVKAEELAVRFPTGTLVTDVRGDFPVEYEQTEEGVTDEQITAKSVELSEGRVKVGQPAPAVELRDLKGRPAGLQDYPGKIVVLVWFTSESRPAAAAGNSVEALNDAYKKRGVQFLGLNVGENAAPVKRAEAFRGRYKWSFPVLLDDGEALRRYGMVAAVPKVAIIDRAGKLVYVQPGVDPDGIAATLDRLLDAP